MRENPIYKIDVEETFFGIPMTDLLVMATSALVIFRICTFFVHDIVALLLGVALGFTIFKVWVVNKHKVPRKLFDQWLTWVSESSGYRVEPTLKAHPLIIYDEDEKQ